MNLFIVITLGFEKQNFWIFDYGKTLFQYNSSMEQIVVTKEDAIIQSVKRFCSLVGIMRADSADVDSRMEKMVQNFVRFEQDTLTVVHSVALGMILEMMGKTKQSFPKTVELLLSFINFFPYHLKFVEVEFIAKKMAEYLCLHFYGALLKFAGKSSPYSEEYKFKILEALTKNFEDNNLSKDLTAFPGSARSGSRPRPEFAGLMKVLGQNDVVESTRKLIWKAILEIPLEKLQKISTTTGILFGIISRIFKGPYIKHRRKYISLAIKHLNVQLVKTKSSTLLLACFRLVCSNYFFQNPHDLKFSCTEKDERKAIETPLRAINEVLLHPSAEFKQHDIVCMINIYSDSLQIMREQNSLDIRDLIDFLHLAIEYAGEREPDENVKECLSYSLAKLLEKSSIVLFEEIFNIQHSSLQPAIQKLSFLIQVVTKLNQSETAKKLFMNISSSHDLRILAENCIPQLAALLNIAEEGLPLVLELSKTHAQDLLPLIPPALLIPSNLSQFTEIFLKHCIEKGSDEVALKLLHPIIGIAKNTAPSNLFLEGFQNCNPTWSVFYYRIWNNIFLTYNSFSNQVSSYYLLINISTIYETEVCFYLDNELFYLYPIFLLFVIDLFYCIFI